MVKRRWRQFRSWYGVRWVLDAVTTMFTTIGGLGSLLFSEAVAAVAFYLANPMTWIEDFQPVALAAAAVVGLWFLVQMVLAPARMQRVVVAEKEAAEQGLRDKDEQLREIQERQGDRSELGRMLSEGNLVRSAAWQSLSIGNDDESLRARTAVAREQCEAWANAVVDYLKKAHPGWSDVFLDESSSIPQVMVPSRVERSRVCNWMERRLAKLNGLLVQLGPASR